MHLLARRGAKLGLDTNQTKDTCFESMFILFPSNTGPREREKVTVFKIDSRYHNRFNLRHVFFILFSSSADKAEVL